MHERNIEHELREIRSTLGHLARALDHQSQAIAGLIRAIGRLAPPPAAGVLDGIFTLLGASMNANLSAILPTTRKDLSALAPTDIASITYQKVPVGQTAQTVLQTNKAASPGAGLVTTDLAYVDTTSTVGDVYTFFVTDTAGNVGDLSNAVTATAVTPPVAAPSAGVLSATFS